ncbi:putative glycoside hydrolase family 5 protein [Phaeomoniella chlamydospora]|uniref:Endoglucanase EG-II n=1 Tax=Phaeomoniella chlamydospora TaxID=158046 RepID=A0A0G2GEM9_PHACM|nr:putative glycoside hydrolase family 5 protein [Phaeomoniella chlamydospora]
MPSLMTVGTLFSTAFRTVQFGGVNIAGFDFGCSTAGVCKLSGSVGPVAAAGGSDGPGQMAHFTAADNMNMFRLPVSWQFLVNNNLGGTLDTTNFAQYDDLVQSCLATGAHCIIDIHNYARWNGTIIGQGGPTDEQFAGLWSQLAIHYVNESNMVFGIMNEPHDIPNIKTWAQTVQAAVTAIRRAGATTQMCLLSGNNYTSAGSFVSSGSAAALSTVTNLDGTTTNLIFDVHKYFDSDNSGTHATCVSDQISAAFSPLAKYLRANNRMAILSEFGGGANETSCLKHICSALMFLDRNSDVYLGYVGWGAGSFATSYVLSLTPFGDNATGWTDQQLVSQCLRRNQTGYVS